MKVIVTKINGDVTDYTVKNKLRGFGAEHSSNMSKFIDESSGFMKPEYLAFIDDMYTIEEHATQDRTGVSFGTLHMGTSERMGVITRDAGKGLDAVYSDGFKNISFQSEGLQIPAWNDSILMQMCSLFLLDHAHTNQETRDSVINYFSTCLYEYVRSALKLTDNNVLQYIEHKVSITRKIDDTKLDQTYNGLVDNGTFVPITPIHYHYYFGLLKLEEWREYALYSAVSNIKMNSILDSVTPKMLEVDKFYFSSYARDRSRLTSRYYTSDVALPFQKRLEFGISFTDFLIEMFVRTMLVDDLPDYIYPVSAGCWNISGVSSRDISPVKLHKVLCKFAMNDCHKDVTQLATSLLMLENKPHYIRGTVRLTDKMPSVYNRYVETSGMKSKETIITNSHANII
jgi:hypothetical protein